MTITSYLEQLRHRCEVHGITLYNAFKVSRINLSTHSRATRSITDLRLKTALKVDAAIDHLAMEARRQESPLGSQKIWGLPDE